MAKHGKKYLDAVKKVDQTKTYLPKEAIEYLGQFPKIESVLFGASSRNHIQETKDLIEKYLIR